MTDSMTVSAEYRELLDAIKQTIAAGRLRAARAANNIMIETYWQIGHNIAERQREQGRGARVIERLSADLRAAHPDMKGLSPRNLEYMATLAARWPESIAQQSAARLPWVTSWSSSTSARPGRPVTSTRIAPLKRGGGAGYFRR